jgi:excisionase family DNA binding protein
VTRALLLVDAVIAAHLRAALAAHMRQCHRDAIPVPPELAALLESLAARSGQERPILATQGDAPDADAVLLGYAAAAARLGISARTVRRRVTEGRIPVVRDGRRRLIRAADLKTYVGKGAA